MKLFFNLYNKAISKDGKKKVILLVVLNKFASLIETFSVFSAFPILFIALGGNFDLLDNKNLKFFFQYIQNNFGQNNFLFISAFIFSIFAVKFIFTAITGFFVLRFNNYFIYDISVKLYKNYISTSLTNRSKSNISKYLNFIEKFSEESISLYFISYINLFKSVFTIVLVILALMLVDLNITILTIIFFFLMGFTYVFFTKKLNYTLGQKKIIYVEKITKNINEAFNSIRELKIYNLENFFLQNFKENKFKYIYNKILGTYLNQFSKFSSEIVLIVSFLFIVYFLKLTLKTNQEIIIILGFFTFAASKLIPHTLNIIMLVNNINKGKASAEKIIYELKNSSDEKKIYLNINKNTDQIINFDSEFKLKEIKFRYSNSNYFILQDINLSFKKGDWFTISGDSGVGKSTLLNLMVGFINPSGGKVIIDGKEINIFEKQNWYKNISIVSQDSFIFDDSLYKNISLRNIEKFSKDEINHFENVIKICKIDQFIDKNKLFSQNSLGERGHFFSNGQKQRIALARALYKKPKILFLDEALNALDKNLEVNIYEELKNLQPMITIVSVSHNQTINNYSDKIYELKN